MLTSELDFNLPGDRVAQFPTDRRDRKRLGRFVCAPNAWRRSTADRPHRLASFAFLTNPTPLRASAKPKPHKTQRETTFWTKRNVCTRRVPKPSRLRRTRTRAPHAPPPHARPAAPPPLAPRERRKASYLRYCASSITPFSYSMWSVSETSVRAVSSAPSTAPAADGLSEFTRQPPTPHARGAGGPPRDRRRPDEH